jgi:hypothetical protein
MNQEFDWIIIFENVHTIDKFLTLFEVLLIKTSLCKIYMHRKITYQNILFDCDLYQKPQFLKFLKIMNRKSIVKVTLHNCQYIKYICYMEEWIKSITQLENLCTLNITKCFISNQILEDLCEITKLQHLNLSYSIANLIKINDLITCVSCLKNLNYLNLDHLKISSNLQNTSNHSHLNDLIKCISNLTNLNYLNLSGFKISDSLQYLSKLYNLKYLHLNLCQIITIDLQYLSKLLKLEVLSLGHNNFNENGEYLEYLSKLVNLQILNLENCRIEGIYMMHLLKLSKLRKINIIHCNIGRKHTDLKYIASLINLTKLEITYKKPKDNSNDCTHYLDALINLRYLKFNCAVRNFKCDLEFLSKLINLEELIISVIYGEWLKYIKTLPYLKHLNILYCYTINDNDLQHLTDLVTLEKLEIGGMTNHITDNGLKHLSGLPNLKQLYCGCSEKITNVGMYHLANIKTLQWLDVKSCFEVTIECIKYFEETFGDYKQLEKNSKHLIMLSTKIIIIVRSNNVDDYSEKVYSINKNNTN